MDMRCEHPRKLLPRTAIPLMGSSLTVLLYSVADSFWIGGLGASSMAAVAAFFPISVLATAAIGGFTGAGVSLVARASSGDQAHFDSVVNMVVTFCFVLFVGLVCLVPVLSKPILISIGAEAVLPEALQYARLMALALLFSAISATFGVIYRAEGRTRTIGLVGALSALLNAALDPLMIHSFGWGVAGAGWASVIAAGGGAAVLAWRTMVTRETRARIMPSLRYFRGPQTAHFRSFLKLGFSLSLSQTLFALLIYANNVVVGALRGPDGIAVYSMGLRWILLILIPSRAFGSAQVPIVAAALGGDDYRRVALAYRNGLAMAVSAESMLALTTFLLAAPISQLFAWSSESAHLVDEFIAFFRVITWAVPALAATTLIEATLTGLGDGRSALMLYALRTALLTFPAVLLLALVMGGGLTGVWSGIVVGNALTAGAGLVLMHTRLKRMCQVNTVTDKG